MKRRWTSGNKLTLLENGEEFYPRVFDSISSARQEVLLETFILYEDKVGKALQKALLTAANRGAQVDITIDGWGSRELSETFISTLTDAGVKVHIFDPAPRWFTNRANLFRRMHRKLVVIDGARAFVGGINYSADHLGDFGPEAKQDYAVEIEGPLVSEIRSFAQNSLVQGKVRRNWFHRHRPSPLTPSSPAADDADAMFVWRDNHEHKNDIERQYRLAIRLARRRLIIANAYFFPGYGLLKELRKAARRGVEVNLILQGNPDMRIVQTAASMLYYLLLKAGVHIYEYCERPFHGKVAVVDDEWATVGSSNLDPLSLSLNLEANVMIHHREFSQKLSAKLQRLMAHSCTKIEAKDLKESDTWRMIRGIVLFHILRRYPAWVGWLPAHTPRIALAKPTASQGHADHITETAGS